MSNLNKQLNEITDRAIMAISVQLDKHSRLINLVSNEDVNLSIEDGDDFYRLIADKTLMITHTFESEGNEDVYIVSIQGDETGALIGAVTQYGDKHEINLFDLDAHNLTLLADYLLNN